MNKCSYKFKGVDPRDTAACSRSFKEITSIEMVVSEKPGFPCRVSLKEADIGDVVWLTNYRHLDTSSPYNASHAIFITKDREVADLEPGVIPEIVENYLVSIRAFDGKGFMLDADVAKGSEEIRELLDRFFCNDAVCEVHVHTARRGCFLARAIRC